MQPAFSLLGPLRGRPQRPSRSTDGPARFQYRLPSARASLGGSGGAPSSVRGADVAPTAEAPQALIPLSEPHPGSAQPPPPPAAVSTIPNTNNILKTSTASTFPLHHPALQRDSPAAPPPCFRPLHHRAAHALLAGLASAALTLAPLTPLLPAPPPAHAEGEPIQIRFPASKDPEIRGAQEILVQAWGYVREYYFDPTFNRQDWNKRLQEALTATFKARDRDEALKQVDVLMGYLGDPFTRVLLPGSSSASSGNGSSEEFKSSMQAKIISNGLLVGRNEGPEGPLKVAYVVPGSPAEAAGVLEGDLLVAVNGRPVGQSPDSALLDALSQDLEVDIKVLRREQRVGPAGAVAGAARAGGGGGGGGSSSSAVGVTGRRGAVRAAALASGAATVATAGTDATAGGAYGASGSPAAAQAAPSAAGREAAARTGSAAQLGAGGSSSGSSSGGLLIAEARDMEGGQGPADFVAPSPPSQPPSLSGGGSGSGSGIASSSVSSSSNSGSSSSAYALPTRFLDFHLTPGPVDYVPVQFAVLQAPSSSSKSGIGSSKSSSSSKINGGSSSRAEEGGDGYLPPSPERVGYIRIVAFTDNVARDVQAAIAALQAAGCGSWLLDVRENPGGIVREGLDVAELLLPPGAPFAVVTGRSGEPYTQYLSEDSQALVYGQPLAVLVDRYSASTSELLAGALRDNARALLVGERTFGKGRTQRVVELSGGATLLVSTDTYTTPALKPVDHIGLPPDVACRVGPPPPPVSRPSGAAGATAGGELGVEVARFGETGVVLQRGVGVAEVREEMRVQDVGALQRDACVRAAVAKLSRAAA